MPPLCCAVCCAVCRPSSCHVRVPHTVVYTCVLRTEIQSMSGLACVRLYLPCCPLVCYIDVVPAVFDDSRRVQAQKVCSEVMPSPRRRQPSLPWNATRHHLKSVPLGVAQAQKVCHGPVPYPRGRQAMQSSVSYPKYPAVTTTFFTLRTSL